MMLFFVEKLINKEKEAEKYMNNILKTRSLEMVLKECDTVQHGNILCQKSLKRKNINGKYNEKDCLLITELFNKSGLSISNFSKTKECYVGYGTLYNMLTNPDFYKNKK